MFSSYFGTSTSELINLEESDLSCEPTGISRKKGPCLFGCGEDGTLLLWSCEWINAPNGSCIPEPKETAVLPLATLMPDEILGGEIKGKVMGVVYMKSEGEPLEVFTAMQIGCNNLLIVTSQLRECNDRQRPFGNILSVCLPLDGINACAGGIWHPNLPLVAKIHSSNTVNILSKKKEDSNSRRECGRVLVATYSGDPNVLFWLPSAKPITAAHDCDSECEEVLQVEWMSDWCGAEETPPVLLLILTSGKVVACELTMLAWNCNLLSQTVTLGLKHSSTLQGAATGFLPLDSSLKSYSADSMSSSRSSESYQVSVVVADIKMDPTAGLGLILRHSGQKALISGFTRHPTTGAMLSAEESGVILVGDHIMSINGVDLHETTPAITAETVAAIRAEGKSYVQVHVRRNVEEDSLLAAAAERAEAMLSPSSFLHGYTFSYQGQGDGLKSLSGSGQCPSQNSVAHNNNVGLKGLSKLTWVQHFLSESDAGIPSGGVHSVLPSYRSLVSLPVPWGERCTLLLCFGVGSERKDICAWKISLDARRDPNTLHLRKLCYCSMPNESEAEILCAKPVAVGDMSDHTEICASSLVGLCGDGWVRRWSIILLWKGTTSVSFSWRDRECYSDPNITFELRSWDLFEVSPPPVSFLKYSILGVSENVVVLKMKEILEDTVADEWKPATTFNVFRDASSRIEDSAAASIIHWRGPHSRFIWPNQPWIKLTHQLHLLPEVFHSPSTLSLLYVWCNEGKRKASELLATTMDSLKEVIDQRLVSAILEGSSNLEVIDSDGTIERVQQIAWKLRSGSTTEKRDSTTISSVGVLAALLSPASHQSIISSSVITYSDVALSMIPLWLKDETKLLSITEKVAASTFRETRDIFGLAGILYAVLGKGNITLRNLAKAEASNTISSGQPSPGKQLLSLLAHDLTSSYGRDVASKNGFILLRKRRFHAAAAVFLLPDPPLLTEAIQTITVHIKDRQLALLISRLVDIRSDAAANDIYTYNNCMVRLNAQRLILNDLLPGAYQRRDTYLEAAYLMLLGEKRRAALALCRGITFEGRDYMPLDSSIEERYDELGIIAWPTLFVALCKKSAENVTDEDHVMDLSNFAHAALLWWGEALLANNCEAACLDAISQAIRIGDILKSEGQPMYSRTKKRLSPSHTLSAKPQVFNRIEASPTQQFSQLEKSVDIFAAYDTAPRRGKPHVAQSVAPIDIFAAYDVPSQSTSQQQQPLTRQNENDGECCSRSTPRHTQESSLTVLLDETMGSYDANELGQWAFQDEKTIATARLATSVWSEELSIRALGKLIAKEICLMLGCGEGCGRGRSVFPSPMDMLSMTKKVHSGILSEINTRISSLVETSRESIPDISRIAVLGAAILSVKPYICDCLFHRNGICFERLPAWVLLLSLAEKGGCSAAMCRASRRLLQMCDMPYSERGPERDSLLEGAWREGCALEMTVALHFTNNISLSSRAILDGVLGFRAALILYASQRKEFWVAQALISCPPTDPTIDGLDSVGLEAEVHFEGMPVKSGKDEGPWALSSTSSPSQAELLGKEASAAYYPPSCLSGQQEAEASLEGFEPGTCILRDGRCCIETGEGERQAFLISFSIVVNRGVTRHGTIHADIVAVQGNKGDHYEFYCGSIGPFDSMSKLLDQISHVFPCGLMLSSDLRVQSMCPSKSNSQQPSWKLFQNNFSPNKRLIEKLSLGSSWSPDPHLTDCAIHSTCHELVDVLESLWLYRVHKILCDYVSGLAKGNGFETVAPLSAQVCGYRIPFVSQEEVDQGDSCMAPRHLEESHRRNTLYGDVFHPLYLWAIRLDRDFCAKVLSLEGWEHSFVSPPLASIDLEAKLIEAGLDYQVNQYAQPDGHYSYFVRCFTKKELELFLESDSVKGEERTSVGSMEAARVIRAACILGRRKGEIPHHHGDKAFDEEVFVVIGRWEVEPMHGGSGDGGVIRFGALGRSVFVPTAGGKSPDMLEDQCRELASYAGGGAALLWKELRCWQWLAKIPSRFLMQRVRHHTLCSLERTVNASALLSCLTGCSFRNACLRRLSLPHRNIPLIRVEIMDLKNLVQCHASRAIDVYAIMRLSSHEEMRDSRGLTIEIQHRGRCQPPGTLVTGMQQVIPSGHAKARRQWNDAVVFRLSLPMPEEDPAVFYPLICSHEAYLQQAKEGMKIALDAPPCVLHVAVFRRALMGDHCMGTGILRLDDLDDCSPIEEWLPLKMHPQHPSKGRSAAWFMNLRLTLRFVPMYLAGFTEKSEAIATTRLESSVCQLSNMESSPPKYENIEVKAFREEGIGLL